MGRGGLLFFSPLVCARVLDISPFTLKNPVPSSQANEEAIRPTSRKLYSRNALEECYSVDKH